MLILFWGKEFRTDFTRIGEIQSLLPQNTNLMATANEKLCYQKPRNAVMLRVDQEPKYDEHSL